MKYSYLFLFSILVFGCARVELPKVTTEDINSKNLNQYHTLENIDYIVINEAIYQSATMVSSLKHRYENDKQIDLAEIRRKIKNFVIIDSTYYYENISDYVISEHSEVDSTDVSWMKNLDLMNSRKSKIYRLPTNYFDYKLLTTQKFDSIFNDIHKGWNNFWELYEYPSVLIHVSIPAYNNTRDKVIIYIDHSITGKNGRGSIIWLKLENNKWKAYDIVDVWIS